MQRKAILPSWGAERLDIVDDASFDPFTPSAADRVIVRVEAACVQSTDLLVRAGSYPSLGAKPPFTPGYDFVGVVESAGAESGFTKGERVCDMPRHGAFARFVERPANVLVRVPAGLDPFEAGTAVLSWMTAYQLLHRSAAAKAVATKEAVFVQGGTGLVGSALVKLAVEAGCQVFTSVRGPRMREAEAMGAVAYDFTQPMWWKAARRDMTARGVNGGGVAVVFDGIGAENFGPSFALLRSGGVLQVYGMHAAMAGKSSMGLVAMARTVKNILSNMCSRSFKLFAIDTLRDKHPDWFKEDLTLLLGRLARGELALEQVEKIGFGGVDAAHERLFKGGVRTALVLDPWQET